jgi:hypothetical protein
MPGKEQQVPMLAVLRQRQSVDAGVMRVAAVVGDAHNGRECPAEQLNVGVFERFSFLSYA